MIKIGVDLLGSDNFPNTEVEGINMFLSEFLECEIHVYGTEESLKSVGNHVVKHVCSDFIKHDDKPLVAIKEKKDSSLVRLFNDSKNLDAVVSCGNTGAIVVGGTQIVKRLKGVARPALAPIFPTVNKKGLVILDVGATQDINENYLYSYAQMGSAFAKIIFAKEKPIIGLLNNGTEESKGPEAYVLAHQKIANDKSLNFHGNLEGKEILEEVVDVLVCDGFSGNILLKTAEGTAKSLMGVLKKEMLSSTKSKFFALMLKKQFQAVKSTLDVDETGGACLLGLRKPVIKAHGSSSGKAFYSALKLAHKLAAEKFVEKLDIQINGDNNGT